MGSDGHASYGVGPADTRRLATASTFVSGLDHVECVAFGPDGRGYAGGEEGQLYQLTRDRRWKITARVGGGIGGLCLDRSGCVYVCNYDLASVQCIRPDGEVIVLAGDSRGPELLLPNYPAFDLQGDLYFSDSGHLGSNDGRLFVIRPDGHLELMLNGLSFPNGLAIDAAGRWLYVAESTAARVVRTRIGGDGLGSIDLVYEEPGCFPDGLALGKRGNLYVGNYVPDLITRVGLEGKVERLAFDPWGYTLNRPTNLAFLPGTTLLCFANFGGDTIGVIDVGERGLPLSYPQSMIPDSAPFTRPSQGRQAD